MQVSRIKLAIAIVASALVVVCVMSGRGQRSAMLIPLILIGILAAASLTLIPALRKKASPKGRPAAGQPDNEAILEAECARRQKTASALPRYFDSAPALKAKLGAELGAIDDERIPSLVDKARDLEEEFWEKGDFEDPASFEHIYQARALLETCLDAKPANEPALRMLLEVLQAGWPLILAQKDMNRFAAATRARQMLVGRNFEGLYAMWGPIWTLWNHHASKRPDPVIDDLAVASVILLIQPPPEFWTSVVDVDTVQKNRSATARDVEAGRIEFLRTRHLEVLTSALAACGRKGAEWDMYANDIRRATDCLKRGVPGGHFAEPVIVCRGNADSVRYGGRFVIFQGPRERRAQLVPLHEERARWQKTGLAT